MLSLSSLDMPAGLAFPCHGKELSSSQVCSEPRQEDMSPEGSGEEEPGLGSGSAVLPREADPRAQGHRPP